LDFFSAIWVRSQTTKQLIEFSRLGEEGTEKAFRDGREGYFCPGSAVGKIHKWSPTFSKQWLKD